MDAFTQLSYLLGRDVVGHGGVRRLWDRRSHRDCVVNRSASLSRLGTDIGESRGSALKHGSTSAESRRLGTSVARRHGPSLDSLTCSDRFVALALWKNQKDCVLDGNCSEREFTHAVHDGRSSLN
jgi:hypothetical protein